MSGYSEQDMDTLYATQQMMPSVYSKPISEREGVPRVEEFVKAEGASAETRRKKQQFAIALAKDPAEPWAAAKAVWPYNTGHAVYVLHNWPADPEIKAYVEAVHDVVGTISQLPTPDEYALFIWKLARETRDDEMRLKYLRLYAEARGHLKRPAGDESGVVVNQNRVMIVNGLGSDEEWRQQAVTQQRALQNELASISDAVEAEVVHESD